MTERKVVSIIPKTTKDSFMIIAIEDEGFILQGELNREQLMELANEITKALAVKQVV